ncbi:MAG: nucleoside-diphosphate sugar epimerase [Cytophagales bacterium CG12_big_fil_rev_8_21_14_0_65_40_12]|nr:MAG: nucleoside-diphosphate sugar epimerase [Cytophagales bacterium CG12_big_fil_rev_8_21_14_0_65_40_12]PIW03745.1 MAG: nucleoside-diphosphate sugar epimerase [Cytophagales bacterium CG17_big_fil_post_rev_8_21_14_2_50_40_13]
MTKVLLTGITGFLGSHTAIQLLNKGYQVTGTLRDQSRMEEIKAVIAQHTDKIENLSFAVADLNDHKIWGELTQNIDFVQHIASPFPRTLPKNEDDLIRPAKEGTLAILNAASKNGVKRVVLTSSTGSIIYGKSADQRSTTFTENDWTDTNNTADSTPYFRSKTIAERAAWEFIKNDKSGMELATICPGAILGPVLEKDFGTSANIVLKIMDGSTPAIPRIGFDMVDARSVAELHVLAMEKPEAANQRFIGSSGYYSFKEVADIIREAYPTRKVPKQLLPNFMVRFISNFDKALKPILIDLGTERKLDNSKAKKLLGWKPIDNKEAVLSCAKSILQIGLA